MIDNSELATEVIMRDIKQKIFRANQYKINGFHSR